MTKSRFNFLTVVALLCVLGVGSRQTAGAADNAEEAQTYRPITIGAEAGTPGLGGSASWRFSDHFGVRAGFNYFSYSSSGDEFMGEKFELTDLNTGDVKEATIDTKLRLMSEPLGFDYFPWKKSTFRITVGIMLNQNEQTGKVPWEDQQFITIAGGQFLMANGTYDGGIPNGIGDLNMKVEQQAVSPYVAIGYSYFFDKAKHWSLSGELGVAYTGSPDVALSTSSGSESTDPILKGALSAEAQQMQDNAWKFYPILRIGVNYSF